MQGSLLQQPWQRHCSGSLQQHLATAALRSTPAGHRPCLVTPRLLPGGSRSTGPRTHCRSGLAVIAPICFTTECAAANDQAFLIAISIPIVVAVAAVAYLLRPPPQELLDKQRLFQDDATGALFEVPEGASPERDKDGELVFKAISYTPWPVADDFEGERVRIPIGPVKDKRPRTFVFPKVLPQPSEIVCVELPRPLGIVFEYDERRKRAVAVGYVEGGNAEQRRKVAGLSKVESSKAVLEGDVLRAATCTNFVYPTKALFGAVPPQRHIVVYGADKQTWASIRGALRKGDKADGAVTLVLERRCEAA